MPRFLARLPYGAKTEPGRGVRLRGGHRRRRPRQVHLGQRRLRDGGEHQPRRSSCTAGARASAASNRGGAVEGLPTHTFPTDDGGVDMKCPTEIAITDRREAELAKNGLHAADPPEEHRLRGVHRRAVAAQAGRVRRPGRDGQRQPGGAPAVPVRHLPLRALPEVHGARQDRLLQGARRHGALAERLDHQLRRRRPRHLHGGDQGPPAAGRGRGSRGGRWRAIPATTPEFFLRPHYQLEGLTASTPAAARR